MGYSPRLAGQGSVQRGALPRVDHAAALVADFHRWHFFSQMATYIVPKFMWVIDLVGKQRLPRCMLCDSNIETLHH